MKLNLFKKYTNERVNEHADITSYTRSIEFYPVCVPLGTPAKYP